MRNLLKENKFKMPFRNPLTIQYLWGYIPKCKPEEAGPVLIPNINTAEARKDFKRQILCLDTQVTHPITYSEIDICHAIRTCKNFVWHLQIIYCHSTVWKWEENINKRMNVYRFYLVLNLKCYLHSTLFSIKA